MSKPDDEASLVHDLKAIDDIIAKHNAMWDAHGGVNAADDAGLVPEEWWDESMIYQQARQDVALKLSDLRRRKATGEWQRQQRIRELHHEGSYPDLLLHTNEVRGCKGGKPELVARVGVYGGGQIVHRSCQRGAFHHLTYVLPSGEVVAGLTIKAGRKRKGERRGTIDRVYTHPEYRRRGYAAALLRQARACGVFSEVRHSDQLTGMGSAWKKAVNPMALRNPDTSYRMSHGAPGPDGAPLHDLTANSVFPPDVYETLRYYQFHAGDARGRAQEAEAERILRAVRGRPDMPVTIYRSLPRGLTTINPGDWVTIVRDYAVMHGMHADDETQDWPVVAATVPAGTVHTNGDSLQEWGYNGPAPVQGRVVHGGGRQKRGSKRNPPRGDERLRVLERAAAHDPAAAKQLAAELWRLRRPPFVPIGVETWGSDGVTVENYAFPNGWRASVRRTPSRVLDLPNGPRRFPAWVEVDAWAQDVERDRVASGEDGPLAESMIGRALQRLFLQSPAQSTCSCVGGPDQDFDPHCPLHGTLPPAANPRGDSERRRLERLAAQGDPAAQAALEREMDRTVGVSSVQTLNDAVANLLMRAGVGKISARLLRLLLEQHPGAGVHEFDRREVLGSLRRLALRAAHAASRSRSGSNRLDYDTLITYPWGTQARDDAQARGEPPVLAVIAARWPVVVIGVRSGVGARVGNRDLSAWLLTHNSLAASAGVAWGFSDGSITDSVMEAQRAFSAWTYEQGQQIAPGVQVLPDDRVLFYAPLAAMWSQWLAEQPA